VAKDEAQWPALRQVTPTNFIAGPLAASRLHQIPICHDVTRSCLL